MRQTLIAANQKGIDWKPLQLGKDGVSETMVMKDVEADANISKINAYNSRFPVSPGEERAPSMIKMTTNAVRYAGLKSGDFELRDYRKNIEQC